MASFGTSCNRPNQPINDSLQHKTISKKPTLVQYIFIEMEHEQTL